LRAKITNCARCSIPRPTACWCWTAQAACCRPTQREALFGYDAADFSEMTFGDLFAPESRRSVTDYLERLARAPPPAFSSPAATPSAASSKRPGAALRHHRRIEDGEKLCAVLRDVTAWKRTEKS